eukprot:110582-Amphidinium_carterae.1
MRYDRGALLQILTFACGVKPSESTRPFSSYGELLRALKNLNELRGSRAAQLPLSQGGVNWALHGAYHMEWRHAADGSTKLAVTHVFLKQAALVPDDFTLRVKPGDMVEIQDNYDEHAAFLRNNGSGMTFTLCLLFPILAERFFKELPPQY